MHQDTVTLFLLLERCSWKANGLECYSLVRNPPNVIVTNKKSCAPCLWLINVSRSKLLWHFIILGLYLKGGPPWSHRSNHKSNICIFTYQIKPWEKIYKAITFFGKIFHVNSNKKTIVLLVREGASHYLAFTWDLDTSTHFESLCCIIPSFQLHNMKLHFWYIVIKGCNLQKLFES